MSSVDSIREFDFWILFPTVGSSNFSVLSYQKAKVFILGQIIVIIDEGKPVRSCQKSPNAQIVLKMYCYNPDTATYTPDGTSSPLKANLLIHNVTDQISEAQNSTTLALDLSGEILTGYRPFHHDIVLQLEADIEPNDVACDSEEEYMVDKVVKQRYNAVEGRYEYYVQWKGYSSAYNTWELESNIPNDMVVDFEKGKVSAINKTASSREGLRDHTKRKATFHPDYIF